VNIVDKYVHVIKPVLIGNSDTIKIDNSVTVFNDESIDLGINPEDFVFAQSVTTSSEISQMDLDVSEILSKNIDIICPVKGTVTSNYGAREEVFKNVGYHTGVDIANSLNTPIMSATSGVVVKTQSMDKYYGNNIEIESNGVIFEYAHLNQISVNEGENVSQGDIIGLMGSTGASTGSHLHFEIRINGRSVDPELLVKVR
jgi:murein DD-endopeptidase MepM/ murein hydrolase activator NlpD